MNIIKNMVNKLKQRKDEKAEIFFTPYILPDGHCPIIKIQWSMLDAMGLFNVSLACFNLDPSKNKPDKPDFSSTVQWFLFVCLESPKNPPCAFSYEKLNTMNQELNKDGISDDMGIMFKKELNRRFEGVLYALNQMPNDGQHTKQVTDILTRFFPSKNVYSSVYA